MPQLNVLIADAFEQVGLDALAELGVDVVFEPKLGADELPDAIARARPDVLVVRSTKVSAEALDAAAELRLVLRAGAGYDTIDLAHASSTGVFVANCPGKNSIAVAELAWGLITSCDRRIPDQVTALRNGTWDKKGFAAAHGLFGRTLGILGFGTIGREVAARGRAFGMDVLVWSRSLTPDAAESAGVRHAATPLAVAAECDVLSVHVAATSDTHHLVNDALVEALKPGAIVINTSRGSVVDEAALRRGVVSKGLRVGLDVYASEPSRSPGEFTNDLIDLPGVYGTHHVGASTAQAQEAIAMEAVNVIVHFARTGQVLNCVNQARRSAATCLLTVRHANQPGVLAAVFEVLSRGGINVEEMENLLYRGHQAACARIRLETTPTDEMLDAIRARTPHVLGLDLTPL